MNKIRRLPFLRQKVSYFLMLAVIGTTLISWFNLNSCLIGALLLWRLVSNGRPLRTVFSDPFFLAYAVLFGIELLGLLYTHDIYTAYKHVESKATLVAIPFVLCSLDPADKAGVRQLLHGYCRLLAAISLFCIGVAAYRFAQTKNPDVFFYHSLTEGIGINAVFFSGYVFVALLFLLSGEGKGPGRTPLIVFFTVMMVLLASKLLLALLAVLLLVWLRQWGRLRWRRKELIGGHLALVIFGFGALAVSPTPVGRRYRDILHDDLRYAGRHTIPPHALFNGISLRLLIWQFAVEILDERKAWVIGVSAGDSQDLLNRKYLAAGMSRGFLSYNFHNQYIEVLVRSGAAGFCIFLAAIGLLVGLARRTATREGWFVLIMLLLLAATESILEMQHSLFLFCFFPLLFSLQAPGRAHPTRPDRMIADR